MSKTIIETCVDATAALVAATQDILGLRPLITKQLADALARTQVVVATATPLSRIWWVDPVNGSDVNDGTSAATALKSPEQVFGLAAPNTRHIMLLLGDAEIQQRRDIFADITVAGAVASNVAAAGYLPAQRTVNFRKEAVNSPLSDGVRTTSGMALLAASLSFSRCDLILAEVPDALGNKCHIIGTNSSSLTITDGTINGVNASNGGRLVTTYDISRMSVWISGAIGPGAQGRIFDGLPAGGNPNAAYRYASNITSH